jgi:hypothetical protein
MGNYLRLFDTVSAFTEAYEGPSYGEPWVSLTQENRDVNYNKPPVPPVDWIYIDIAGGGMFWQDTLEAQGKWGPGFTYTSASTIYVNNTTVDPEGTYHECRFSHVTQTGKNRFTPVTPTPSVTFVEQVSDEPLGEPDNWLVAYNLNITPDN